MLDPDNPGQPIQDENLIVELKRVLSQLAGQGPGRFPGAQPVSLLREHLEKLQHSPFLVCEKTDGVRYLLLIHTPHIHSAETINHLTPEKRNMSTFLVDRKNMFYPLPELDYYIGFNPPQSMLNHTLLDGEVVYDTMIDPVTGEERRQSNFYIFDTISIRGTYVGNLSLTDRLRVAKGEFIQILWDWVKKAKERKLQQPGLLIPELPFNVVLKRMFDKKQLDFVFTKVIPTLPHENDGLIFTADDKAYQGGTCHDILKWKPLKLNSVDFMLEAVWAKSDTGEQLPRYCKINQARRGSPEFYGYMYVDTEQQAELYEKYAGQAIIVEVVREPSWPAFVPPAVFWSEARTEVSHDPLGGWKFHRVREDKLIPNDIRTVANVERSMNAGITQDSLCEMLVPLKPKPTPRRRSSSANSAASAVSVSLEAASSSFSASASVSAVIESSLVSGSAVGASASLNGVTAVADESMLAPAASALLTANGTDAIESASGSGATGDVSMSVPAESSPAKTSAAIIESASMNGLASSAGKSNAPSLAPNVLSLVTKLTASSAGSVPVASTTALAAESAVGASVPVLALASGSTDIAPQPSSVTNTSASMSVDSSASAPASASMNGLASSAGKSNAPSLAPNVLSLVNKLAASSAESMPVASTSALASGSAASMSMPASALASGLVALAPSAAASAINPLLPAGSSLAEPMSLASTPVPASALASVSAAIAPQPPLVTNTSASMSVVSTGVPAATASISVASTSVLASESAASASVPASVLARGSLSGLASIAPESSSVTNISAPASAMNPLVPAASSSAEPDSKRVKADSTAPMDMS